jgi:hypothetical protein
MIDDRDQVRLERGLPPMSVRDVCAAALVAVVALPAAWVLLALLLL